MSALSFALLALSTFTAAAPTTSQTTSQIQWSPCPSPLPQSLQCAQFKVPIDWAQPSGDTITLGLTKINAIDPKKRIGNLFYNPGGPGEGASTSLTLEASGIPYFGEALSTHFDIIGVDPRGVGLSTPVQCDPNIWNQRVSLFPQTQNGYLKLAANNRAVWASCSNATGALLGHLDTTSVARDFEAVRKALGGGKMTFLGASYGSQLGIQYAELFPNSYRAMALDAILDHDQSEAQALVGESSTYEIEVNTFVKWCASTTDCPLYGKNITGFITSLLDKADKSPIPAPGCVQSQTCFTNVTGDDIRFNIQSTLAFKDPISAAGVSGWTGLATALIEAASGNATLLSSNIATSTSDPLFADIAILCNDWTAASTSQADLLYKNEITSITSPVTRGASQFYTAQTKCIGFPRPVANPPRRHHVQNGNNKAILLVQSTRDPECNPQWAVNVQSQIDNSVLVWRKGDGHSSYNLFGRTSKVIEAYLVNGTIPVAGTVYNS